MVRGFSSDCSPLVFYVCESARYANGTTIRIKYCYETPFQAGNKADLESRRKVEFEEANAYAEENGILHLETSAKNSNNVRTLFIEIAKRLPKTPTQPERESFPLMPPKQEKRSCC